MGKSCKKPVDYDAAPKPGYVFIDVVSGVEGPCLTIGDQDTSERVAGPKPWGGGSTTHRFEVSAEVLRRLAVEYTEPAP